MKVAVIGCGKTGKTVLDLLCESEISDVFDSQNMVTVEKLNKASVAIVFVSAEILRIILPILLQSKVVVICGATGFHYDKNFMQGVKNSEQTWIVSNNFSLSMILIKEMLNTLGNLQSLVNNTCFHLTETHHTQKIDNPSATALSWKGWLNVNDCSIVSIRKEDVKGEHVLQVKNDYETIELKHIAHDRRLFAEGALWSARFVCENNIKAGFYQFDELLKGVIWQ